MLAMSIAPLWCSIICSKNSLDASTPSLVDTREIALKDITAVGILSASPGLAGAIASFASGAVVPDAIVSEVISLAEVPSRLEGERGPNAGPGPKVHVDPRLPM